MYKRQELQTRLRKYPEMLERIKYTTIYNRTAFRVIRQCDKKDTLFYLDPPYPETFQEYGFIMKRKQFNDLIGLLKKIKGKFLLSCYKKDWMKFPKKWEVSSKKTHCCVATEAKSKNKKIDLKREETLITNFKPMHKQLSMPGFFP